MASVKTPTQKAKEQVYTFHERVRKFHMRRVVDAFRPYTAETVFAGQSEGRVEELLGKWATVAALAEELARLCGTIPGSGWLESGTDVYTIMAAAKHIEARAKRRTAELSDVWDTKHGPKLGEFEERF